MTTDTTIRSIRTEDAEAIRRVARKTWLETYSDIHGRETTEQLIDDWYAVDVLRDDIENDDILFFVAEREEVVGFISLVVTDETSKFDLADHEVEFRQIYVDPDHWRSGIGTRLNERAHAEAADRGMTRVKTLALADNDISHKFQDDQGHEIVDEVEITVAGEEYDATVHAFDIPT